MSLAHKKSLLKNVYSPGQWYSYFYLPPKSQEMSRYYETVETELSGLYSFLPKDQIHGKILDFLGVPNIGGKIKKSKLHKIFIFETSVKGKTLLARQENQVNEVKIYPPKSQKLYEGPFKFFKSKNSRKLCEVAGGNESVGKCVLTAHASTPTTEMTSHSDDQLAIQPPSSKIEARSLGEPSKLDVKKPAKPCEGPFKLFKSKNSRIRGESIEVDVHQASRSRDNSSTKAAVKEYHTTAQVISESSDESDVLDPRRSKIKARASRKQSKQSPERPNLNKPDGKSQMKIARNPPRKASSFWYENSLSSESSKSYSVESDEDFVKSISSKNKNKCSSSDQYNRAELSGAGNPQPVITILNSDAAPPSAGKTAEPNILSSVDSDKDDLSKQVLESRSAPIPSFISNSSASNVQDFNQVLSTLRPEGTASEKSHSKDYDHALETNSPALRTQTVSSKLLPDENTPNKMCDPSGINPNRKTVEFKDVEYHYYDRDASSSLTQRSSHRSDESKATGLDSDSSDGNDCDTGFISPMCMSQESQVQSQDVMDQNSVRDYKPSDTKPREWVPELVHPQFTPVSPPLIFPGSSGFAEETPRRAPPLDQNKSMVLQNVQKMTCSPPLPQHLTSASPLSGNLGMFPSDLELIRRIGSLKSVEEENLSQISAATEIISARIMVDLRDPGAFEAIQQHCRSIYEAVNSQTFLSTTPMAINLAEPRSELTLPCQKENNQLVKDPTCSAQQIPSTDIPFDEQRETHMVEENLQSNTDVTGLAMPVTETASQRSRVPSEFESTADEVSSIISQPIVGYHTMTTPRRRKKLPFKKRWPVLSAPKLNIIDFNCLPAQENPKESSGSVRSKSPTKTSTTDSAVSNVKNSSVVSPKNNLNNTDVALPAEILKPSLAGETTSAKNSSGTNSIQRSSVTRVDLTRSVDPAAKIGIVTDCVKPSRSVNSADALTVKSSPVAGVKAAGLMGPGFTHSKHSLITSIGSSSVNQLTSANTKTASKNAVKMSRSSSASFKTASPMNSVAASNETPSANTKAISGGQPQDTHSLPAEKCTVESYLDSEKLQQQHKTAAFQQNRGCGSHSSKASLKEWQRQANLVWKMTLPHISRQFFNDPETSDVRAICDDLISRSGLTLSEPSIRVRAQGAVEVQKSLGNLELDQDTCRNSDKSEEDDLEDTTDMGCTPSPKSNLEALSPFMRDFLFDNPWESVYPNDVDPDAETQLRSCASNIDADPLGRNYSRDQESFLAMSIASCSTAEKAGQPSTPNPGRSRQSSAIEDHSGPPYPVWWQREYSTPKHTFLEGLSASDDSMKVILPTSQVQRGEPRKVPPPDDSFLPTARRRKGSNDTHNDVQQGRTSSVQTRIIKKPPTPEPLQDFFISFDRKTSCGPKQ